MASAGDEKSAVEEAIGWIQRVAVETLDLAVEPEHLAPESRFTELEVTRMGDVLDLDLDFVANDVEDATTPEARRIVFANEMDRYFDDDARPLADPEEIDPLERHLCR